MVMSINDEKLKELFFEFGTITSCKVVLESNGHSKGYGFVAFSPVEDASKVLNEMNGKMIGRKPVCVVVTHAKKRGRFAYKLSFLKCKPQVQLHLCLLESLDIIQGHQDLPLISCILVKGHLVSYHLSQQDMVFQQHLFQDMRPSVVPNFIMPYHLQRQGSFGQRMGAQRIKNVQ